jgi:asparagine synthase (glutamine-hydrolysing)
LRDRLTTSVDIATACDGKVSADLSGGFDSTSLCFLAARNHRHLLTFSSSGRANADDDLPWIELARQNLPSTRHLFVASDELPGPFDGISDFARMKADEPYIGTAMWKRIEFTAKTLQAAGSHFHITGHGGDEVLLSPDTYLYEWIRQRPLTATRRLNQFRSKRRWTFIALARAMLQSSTYQAYIGKVSNNIDLPFPEHLSPATCWGALEQRLPCWVSTHAVDLVRQLLREQGERFVPLHPSPAQHRCLEMIRSGAHAIRLTSQIMRQAGIRMVAPFLDDQIIDACLSVRHDEKTLPTSYKPLLSAAMQEIVPRTLLERSTKPNFGIDVFRGRRRNAEDLVAIAENLELVRIGLVRKDMFRDACLGLGQPTPPIALWKTLACEGWLRGLQI